MLELVLITQRSFFVCFEICQPCYLHDTDLKVYFKLLKLRVFYFFYQNNCLREVL